MRHSRARPPFGLVVIALVLTACAEKTQTVLAPDDVLRYGAGTNMSEWSTPTGLATLNMPAPVTDGCPFVTKSGDALYFASNRPGPPLKTDLDLYVSHWDSEKQTWGTPVNLGAGVNTPSAEQCPLVLNSGKELIFVSGRSGGAGDLDLWVATRDDHRNDLGWGSPVNLTALNSSAADFGPGAYEDESGAVVVYFNSNRPGGLGVHDLYTGTRPPGGTFSAPTPVADLNTPAEEQFASLAKDGREIFFSSSRAPGQGGLDLWHATRERTSDPWRPPSNLGPTVNSSAAEGRSAISWDGMTLFFHSNRGTPPQVDLYQTTRVRSTGRSN